jgi:hypothetical protein
MNPQRYQNWNNKHRCNEDIRNRLADNRVSIKDFFRLYYLKHRKETYKEFLEDFNLKNKFTTPIRKAAEDFWKVSF